MDTDKLTRACYVSPQHVSLCRLIRCSLQGYPGNLVATVTYLLTADNELQITMEATTDAATPVNLAQHTYFNLNGASSASDILNHAAQINA